jgi:hypothetical protein
MARDDVRRRVDEVQRLVQHRQRARHVARGELLPDVDDPLPELLLVGFGAFELASESRDFVGRVPSVLPCRHASLFDPDDDFDCRLIDARRPFILFLSEQWLATARGTCGGFVHLQPVKVVEAGRAVV